MRPGWTGYLLVGISALGFSTLGIFAKYGYSYGLNLTTMLAWRFAVAGALLWGYLLLRRQPLPAWPDVVRLFLLGALGYNAMSVFFFAANRLAPAGLVTAVLYTYPALVTLLVALLGWERITWGRLVAMLGAGSGCILVVLSGGAAAGSEVATGTLLALGSAVVYAVYITLSSRVLERVPALQATAVICSASGVTLGAWGLLTGSLQRVPLQAMWPIGGQVLLATLLAVMAFFAGMRRIGPFQAAIASTLEPVGSALLGAVLFAEGLTGVQLLGGVLVLGSVIALQVASRVPPTAPAVAPGAAG